MLETPKNIECWHWYSANDFGYWCVLCCYRFISVRYLYLLYVMYIFQLPPIFDELLANFKEFRFSKTCVDVLTSNFLCPMCVNQPLMCPGRCSEIVIGCLSPLNQAVVQLDTSLRLIFCKECSHKITTLCTCTHAHTHTHSQQSLLHPQLLVNQHWDAVHH